MASSAKGSVRMGPVTLLSTVIIVCLATLAVLSICTAIISARNAQNQSTHIATVYAEEKAAQEFVAQVDGILAQCNDMPDALSVLREQLPPGAQVNDDGIVRIAFTAHNTHTLNVTLKVNDNLTYSVLEWKTITQWNDDGQDLGSSSGN